MAFTELPAGMSFTTLMGLEDPRGSSDSAVKKLSKEVMAVINVASISQLFNKPAEEAAELQTIAEETMSVSAETLKLPTTTLLIKQLIVPATSVVLREEVPLDDYPEPEEQPMLIDQSQTTEAQVEEQTALEEQVMNMT